jgi:DNA mismatch repair protein MutH
VLSQLLSGAVHKATNLAGFDICEKTTRYKAVMPQNLLHKMGFSGRLNPLLHAKSAMK